MLLQTQFLSTKISIVKLLCSPIREGRSVLRVFNEEASIGHMDTWSYLIWAKISIYKVPVMTRRRYILFSYKGVLKWLLNLSNDLKKHGIYLVKCRWSYVLKFYFFKIYRNNYDLSTARGTFQQKLWLMKLQRPRVIWPTQGYVLGSQIPCIGDRLSLIMS